MMTEEISRLEKLFEKLDSREAKVSDFVKEYFESPKIVLELFCETYGLNREKYLDLYLGHLFQAKNQFDSKTVFNPIKNSKSYQEKIKNLIAEQALYLVLGEVFDEVNNS